MSSVLKDRKWLNGRKGMASGERTKVSGWDRDGDRLTAECGVHVCNPFLRSWGKGRPLRLDLVWGSW